MTVPSIRYVIGEALATMPVRASAISTPALIRVEPVIPASPSGSPRPAAPAPSSGEVGTNARKVAPRAVGLIARRWPTRLGPDAGRGTPYVPRHLCDRGRGQGRTLGVPVTGGSETPQLQPGACDLTEREPLRPRLELDARPFTAKRSRGSSPPGRAAPRAAPLQGRRSSDQSVSQRAQCRAARRPARGGGRSRTRPRPLGVARGAATSASPARLAPKNETWTPRSYSQRSARSRARYDLAVAALERAAVEQVARADLREHARVVRDRAEEQQRRRTPGGIIAREGRGDFRVVRAARAGRGGRA